MIWRTRVSKSRLKASGVFPLHRGQPAATECQMGNWRSHNRFANSPEHENRRAPRKTPARNCFSCHSLSPRLVSGYCGIENKSARAPPPPDGSDRRCGRHWRDVFPYPSENLEVVRTVVEGWRAYSGDQWHRVQRRYWSGSRSPVGEHRPWPCYPNSDDEGLAECYAAIVSATPLPFSFIAATG